MNHLNELAARVGQALTEGKRTLATAESCTGGLIGHAITNAPGSSAYYIGGVVAYANAVKTGLLTVSLDDLEKHGAVSATVARQMAQGARRRLHADCGLGVTGVAGPGGGGPDKPVGLVWVAADVAGDTAVREHRFSGDRGEIKEQAAAAALELLLETLS